MTSENGQALDRWLAHAAATTATPPPQVGSYHNPARLFVRSQTEARLREDAGLPPAGETLATVDAAVEGRCAGPGCSAILTEQSASAYWCSPACQESWQRQQANRPGEVRGSEEVDPSAMRWRPDLVGAFDDTALELVDELTERTWTRRWYRHSDGRGFLRLDDGHRWVGAWARLEGGPQLELWCRLERELTDQRRLDPSPPAGPQPDTPVFYIGERVYYERDRDALVGWLRANGLDSDFVRQGQSAIVTDDQLTVESFVTGPDGHILFDELLGGPRIRRVTVPLVHPPPEPRFDLLRRMGEAFDRAVLGDRAGQVRRPTEAERTAAYAELAAAGTVFWLSDSPADPEAPTPAELAGGVELGWTGGAS